jgi:DNA processing protein
LFSRNRIKEIKDTSLDYPKEWKAFSDAPKCVYAMGDLSLLKERKFVVVGSRRTPAPALKLGEGIVRTLANNVVIVTGTADGGDGAAIEGALASGGKIICVLAGGFSSISQTDFPLMERVAKNGLILSPYPYDTTVRSFSYEYRNKLLAALGEGVLVMGAAERSGALITARYAYAQKKPIFAFPYFPGSAVGEGCNAILKNGGILTENVFDIARVLDINLEERTLHTVQLTVDELKVMTILRNLAEGHIMEIAAGVSMPTYKTKAVLSSLEVKGCVVSIGGNRYKPL